MRHALLIALTAAAALAAGQGYAQDEPSGHPPAPAASAAPAADAKAAPGGSMMAGMDPAAMHEMCMGMMDHQKAGKSGHKHKSSAMAGPNGKPMTKDEMAAMHEKCMGMMSAHPAPDGKVEPPK